MPLQQDKTNERMFRLGLTMTQLSVLSGVGDGKISSWLRCTRPISNAAYAAIDQTLTDVTALVALVDPVPLDLRNCVMVKSLLEKMKRGELTYLSRAKELAADPRCAEAFEEFKKIQAL